jgi:integrase
MCTHLNRTGATYYFRRKVPDDLQGFFSTSGGKPRTEWKRSLGTKDREEAKRLLRSHVIETDSLIDEARAALTKPLEAPAPRPQSTKDRARWEWDEEQDALRSQALFEQDCEIEEYAPAMDAIAAGIAVPEEFSRNQVERAARLQVLHERERAQAIQQALQYRLMVASDSLVGGNALPSGTPGVFGSYEEKVSISKLYERYAKSDAANPKTVAKWRGPVADFVRHLGHDDVRRVVRADLNSWTASLVAKGLAKKTITAGYVPPVRVTLGLAFDDGTLATNPASNLKVNAPKPVEARERDLTMAEAITILSAALAPQPAKLAQEHSRARRWVPWLCAYTGARVGEITQLRAQDIKREEGVWFIHITPEAGSVKTGKARKVPLHSHLIEQGFLDLAKPGNATPLFYREGAGNKVNPAAKIRASDLAKWVRGLGVTAPQPNHGWRHRFKTVAFDVKIDPEVADIIQGHEPRTQAGRYGQRGLVRLKEEIEKLPRYILPS